MARRNTIFLLSLLLLLPVSCRDETPASGDAEEGSAEAGASEPVAPEVTTRPLRERLDQIQPSIPIYPGARLRNGSGTNGDRFDLETNDPFPMVWHYYVLYFEQYRGWDHPGPFPRAQDSMRQLSLDLDEIMIDPFIPGSELPETAPRVTIELRELPSNRGVALRYSFDERDDTIMPTEPDSATAE